MSLNCLYSLFSEIGSKEDVGSSKIFTGALLTIDRAIAIFCHSPPEISIPCS